jgi:hypothetical protein
VSDSAPSSLSASHRLTCANNSSCDRAERRIALAKQRPAKAVNVLDERVGDPDPRWSSPHGRLLWNQFTFREEVRCDQGDRNYAELPSREPLSGKESRRLLGIISCWA